MNVNLPSSTNPNTTGNFHGLKIFAVGDLNNDKMNDLVTVSDDFLTVQAHYYDIETQMFTSSQSIPVSNSQFTIESIFIGKDSQSLQSLYITIQNADSTFLKVFNQTEQFKFQEQDQGFGPVQIQFNSQPFFLDINGDRM